MDATVFRKIKGCVIIVEKFTPFENNFQITFRSKENLIHLTTIDKFKDEICHIYFIRFTVSQSLSRLYVLVFGGSASGVNNNSQFSWSMEKSVHLLPGYLNRNPSFRIKIMIKEEIGTPQMNISWCNTTSKTFRYNFNLHFRREIWSNLHLKIENSS